MSTENNISGYTIKQTLYKGNFNVVYRANNNENKNVILKTLLNPYPGSSEIAHLTKEYNTLHDIDVAGINKVFEIIKHENRPVLVIEDFGGITLRDYFSGGDVTLKTFLQLATKIADIVSHLHSKNIMHKDLNPDNIIINKNTSEIRIIDFGICAHLSRERTSVRNPNVLEGTLQYMSPEQTGRMNRSTDYRTDLYSLGITFYELLGGELPFKGDDAMELVHCHIAKKITPLEEVKASIPKVLSDIVVKLTSKIADDRYQSAIGLKNDLEKCLQTLDGNSIPFFVIGEKDVFSKFKIPENLYGRDAEVETLMQSYDAVARGNCKLLLINGFAGIGKTALVNEIHKPTVHKNGYFIAGKFDQFKSNIPFNAFAVAFSDLLKQLLSEPKSKLEKIKKELTDALGLNASVLTEIIPEFELILGKQSSSQELNTLESQNRFFFTLRDFIKVFAAKEHPLTIFLDDLQWCDDASLSLIRELIIKEIPYLFIIGAYRNNEVQHGHPLALTIEEIRKTKTVDEISLSALDEKNANQLIADTLMSSVNDTSELAAIIHKRTAGNPFYINELLKTIYNDGLINFQFEKSKWVWDVEKISAMTMASNVVEFMAAKLKELPSECLSILKIAACIGNIFDLKTLNLITQKHAGETASALWDAIVEEIIIPLNDEYKLVSLNDDFGVTYKFHHDRIQQAAYSLIDDGDKKMLHLKIGRTLLKTLSEEEKNEKLIQLVRHFNEGRNLITDAAEKLKLAAMNLQAGKKAQSAVAYRSALNYFKTGIDLLPDNCWQNHYTLTFDLFYCYAQNAYLTNELKIAEDNINLLLSKAQTKLDKVKIFSMRLRQYTTLGKADEAIGAGIEGLAMLGIKIPHKPNPLIVLKEVISVKFNIGKRKAAELVNLPLMQDAEKKAAARILTDISPAAYIIGNDNLYGLAALKVVNLSLKYGVSPDSPYSFCTYGAVLGEAFKDYKSSNEFGKLGVALNERMGDIEYKCRVISAYGVLMHHFNYHWSEFGDWFKKGIEAGYLSGDLFFHAYCAVNALLWNPNLELGFAIEEYKKYLKIVKDTGYVDALDAANIQWQNAKNLQGVTHHSLTLSDDGFDENKCLAEMLKRKYLSGIAFYRIAKAQVFLRYEKYDDALTEIAEADKLTKSLVGNIYGTLLSLAAFYTSAGKIIYTNPANKKVLLKRMDKELSKLKKLAAYNPVNFEHHYLLMQAEKANVENRRSLAAYFYEKAIKDCNQNNWLGDEAYANELAAKFYFKNGIKKAASGYMQEAYYLYNKWGAHGKTKFIKENYAELLKAATHSFTTTSNAVSGISSSIQTDGTVKLDVDTIVKSSQAISGEIVLENLIQKMMALMLENAGAQRSVMMLDEDGLFNAVAEIDETLNVVSIKETIMTKYAKAAQSVLNYVAHTGEPIVLDNASTEARYANDEYIKQSNVQSLLCIPVKSKGKVTGILYLENNLVQGAFTKERIEVLNLLATQASISLENAKLYNSTTSLNKSLKKEIDEKVKVQEALLENEKRLEQANQTLETRVTERTAELSKTLDNLKQTQAQLIHSEKMASLGQLTAGIAHEIKNPLNFVTNFSIVSQHLVDEIKSSASEKERNEIIHDLEENLKRITNHGKRADSIVNSMLMHSTTGTSQKQATDINALINESANFSLQGMKSQIHGFDCKLSLHLAENLPLINIVSEDVNRVFLNLFSNAFQAMNERKRKEHKHVSELILTTVIENNQLAIKIKDNGFGISKENIDKIFLPFFSTKPTGQGTGLGLSISYEIIKNHNGQLKVQSEVGKGCEFVILLPK